jgi:hypothetical protein
MTSIAFVLFGNNGTFLIDVKKNIDNTEYGILEYNLAVQIERLPNNIPGFLREVALIDNDYPRYIEIIDIDTTQVPLPSIIGKITKLNDWTKFASSTYFNCNSMQSIVTEDKKYCHIENRQIPVIWI